MEFPTASTECAGGLGSKFLFNVYKAVLEGSAIPDCFAEGRTVFIPKTSDIDDNGRIIRSPDALRPLTLCNCDCKLLTSAICRGLHWYTMRCIHPSQRCISSRQLTDTASFKLKPPLWQMSSVLRKHQVSFGLTSPLHIPVSVTPGSSLCSRTLGCLAFSVASCEVFMTDSIAHMEFAGAER